MVAIDFHLLGASKIVFNGEPLDDKLLNKDCALLFYLAATRTVQQRTALATLLWGEHIDGAARGNLRKALSMLHQIIGDLLQIDHEQIGLAAGAWTCDAGLFEQDARAALKSGITSELAAAAERYTGDFLAGFNVHNAPDFDLWQAQVRERLRGLVVDTLFALAQQQLDDDDPVTAAATFERILLLESWNEEAHRGRMVALAQCGQRSAALRQYQRCVEQLAAELAVHPSAETRAIYAWLVAGEMSAAPPPSTD